MIVYWVTDLSSSFASNPMGIFNVSEVDYAAAKMPPRLLGQVRWQTAWEDEGRRQWHESKMSSKLDRADKQMVALGIKKGTVIHLE